MRILLHFIGACDRLGAPIRAATWVPKKDGTPNTTLDSPMGLFFFFLAKRIFIGVGHFFLGNVKEIYYDAGLFSLVDLAVDPFDLI